MDSIAEILKGNTDRRFLITGQTDARGSEAYNDELSNNRARTVVKALVDRGVPSSILKYRGVGKRIAAVNASDDNSVREGDRKTVIEIVSNPEYWEYPAFKSVK